MFSSSYNSIEMKTWLLNAQTRKYSKRFPTEVVYFRVASLEIAQGEQFDSCRGGRGKLLMRYILMLVTTVAFNEQLND